MADEKGLFEVTETREAASPSGGAGRGRWIPIVVAAALIAVAFGFLTYALYGYNRIYPNVRADDLNLGTMTKAQALRAVETHFSGKYNGQSLKLIILDTEYMLDADELGLGIDAAGTAQNAMDSGRSGGPVKRLAAILRSATGGASAGISFIFNEDELNNIIDNAVGAAYSVKKEYSHEVTENHIVIDNATLGASVNRDELYDAIVSRFENFDFSDMVYTPQLDEPRPLDIEALHKQINILPVNAFFDKDNKKIVPDRHGLTFDIERAEKALESKDEKIYIPLIKIIPEITTEALEEKLFSDILTEYKTFLNPGNINRTNNVRLASNAINETILAPGEEFSYNNIVGQRTAARGYKDAYVYIAGEVVEDIGGGICQVSSTLYAAVLHANLKIVERTNHSFSVTYVPLGLDATVYWGSIDFRFENDTGYPIKILSVQSGNYVLIQILGTKENDNRVEMKTKTLSHTPYGTNTIEDPTLPYGTKRISIEGHSASVVEAYKIIYDGNGKEISNRLESKNTYKLLNQTVIVGTKDRPEDIPEVPGDITPPDVVAPPTGTPPDDTAPSTETPHVDPTFEPSKPPQTPDVYVPPPVPGAEPTTAMFEE